MLWKKALNRGVLSPAKTRTSRQALDAKRFNRVLPKNLEKFSFEIATHQEAAGPITAWLAGNSGAL